MNRLATCLALLLASPWATACSCGPIPEPEAFAGSTSVFLARVVETTMVRDDRPGFEENFVRARFEVVEPFKGDPSEVSALEGFHPRDMCAEPLEVGALYLVYARDGPVAFVSSCGPSRRFEPQREPELLARYRAAWRR